MIIKYELIPTINEPSGQIEGHVMEPLIDGPPDTWLAHLIVRKSHGLGSFSFGRNELAAFLRFVAKNDPDMYQRMGEYTDRERRRT